MKERRVLVFSPHPDDDVISMGGMLRKLWENRNQIVVAYLTSGNIAVFDEDVRRHLHFVERGADVFVAGDLSDPHGTHRMCKAAVDRALAGGDAAVKPEVWLYRGAWQEWSIPEADVLVPPSSRSSSTSHRRT